MSHSVKMLSEYAKKDTFCILPFIGVSICHDTISPCCKLHLQKFDISNADRSLDEFFGGHQLKNMQNCFLNNQIPKACEQCFSKTNHYPSLQNNQFLKFYSEDAESNAQISQLTIMLSNVCNLACRMCGPFASSTIDNNWDNKLIKITNMQKTSKRFKNNVDEIFSEILNNDKFKTLKSVIITGGEPLLHKNLFDFLERLYFSGTKYVAITTRLSSDNFNFLEQFNLLDFSKKIINVSIDGDKIVHQYVSHFLKIDELEKNIGRISTSSITTIVTFTASIFNCHNIIRAAQYIETIAPTAFLRFNFVTNDYLQFYILPQSLKENVFKKFKSDLAQIKLTKFNSDFLNAAEHYLISGLNTNPDNMLFNKFQEYTNHLDEKYKTDILEIFPDLRGYLSFNKNESLT